MNRTQEQYSRNGHEVLADPYEGTYGFPELSDWRLDQRLADVMESAQIPHNEPRRANVAREMNHLIFETEWRRKGAEM
jgi:hypothetical protein